MKDREETKGAEPVGSDFSSSGHVNGQASLKEKSVNSWGTKLVGFVEVAAGRIRLRCRRMSTGFPGSGNTAWMLIQKTVDAM
jgi:hypothetical protein